MEVSYRRDLNHNYMILENDRITGQEYMVRMIEQNRIPELLEFQVRKMNGRTYLYYEITSRQPVAQIYEGRALRSQDIRNLLTGVRDGLDKARQYLLDGRDLLLDPEYLYMDPDTRKIQLCYVPYSGQDEDNTFLKLAEYILKHLDHGEKAAVDLGYALYNQSVRENFSLTEVIKLLLQEDIRKENEVQNREILPERQEKENKEQSADRKSTDRPPKTGKRTKKEALRQETAAAALQKQRKRRAWLAACLGAAAGLVVFGAVVYFGELDLTQTGGLAFLLLAIIWLIYSSLKGKEKRGKWMDEADGEELDEEEAYLEALMQEGLEMPEATEDQYKEKDEEEWEELDGATRCLTETERGRSFRLVSLEADKYGDILLDKQKLLVGKRKEQADIWLKDPSVSRLHARLEQEGESCFVTDLNSLNGTFIEGQRLMPNERREARDGMRISFAARHYRLKIREF